MARSAGLLPAGALFFIITGLVLRFAVGADAASLVWGAGLAVTGAPVVWNTLRGVAAGRLAADVVAMLAIVAALLLGEPLAGLIVVLLQTGGEALEHYAEGRASEAVRELEAAAPRIAHRIGAGDPEEIPVDAVVVGDHLLVRPGELIPCDCEVVEGTSAVDTSRITGEPIPVSARPGIRFLSGSQNLESPLRIRATAPAGESQYARIVELVRTAQASKSPLQRMADRYAVWFTPLTLAVCGAAYALSGDPVRALAVLVVATPCPLIIATPVAVIGGINRAARYGIVFRHGTALEQLGQVTVGLFDKTGTVTLGRPRVKRVLAVPRLSDRDLLELAASVEQGSGHLLARTVVEEARARGIAPAAASDIVEVPGQGVTGSVDGREVGVGGWSFLTGRYPGIESDLRALLSDGDGAELRAYVAVDRRAGGIIEYADRLRPELEGLMPRLRKLGLRQVALLSGDDQANTEAVARAMGIEEARGNLLPADQVAYVERLVKAGEKVLMVGDGTNDAPALSSATVGIAMASGGGGITAEAADAVILADDPARVVTAIAISRRTVRLARQSIWAGLGLSALGMGAASLGWLPPVAGALAQEAIDVAVILNALRASFPPARNRPH
jgi:heavy metal translocating P-type ATPase